MTVLLTWLGGAHAGVTDRHERTGYSVTGAVVALFALTAGVITALATGAANWPIAGTVAVASTATLLVGAISRTLATAAAPGKDENTRARAEFGARIGVAAVVGIVIAEMACTVLFGGSVNRLLDETARRGVESAPAVVTARTELDQARTDRKDLDQQITKAQNDVDTALVTARCETNPDPQCPSTRITRVPGYGPEARTANQMLDDARAQLTAARAKIDGLDSKITDKDRALGTARTAAYTDGDRGLGARWVAMNDYTTGHAGPLALRLAVALLLIVLALLPVLLRFWRGETAFDRELATRTATDRAAQAAATAIAEKQAETRVEAEKLRAEQQLTAAELALHADTAIDREKQRTRIIAAIGNFQIGITEPAQQRAIDEFDRAAQPELPAGNRTASSVSQEGIVTPTPNLPAQLTQGAVTPVGHGGALAPAVPAPQPAPANKGGGLELPIIGTVPFTDTAARWIRPLVPSFVANAIDTATHPLRTVRQAFEEAEEITFTLKRTRKVTMDSTDSAQAQQMYQPQYGYQLPPGAQQHAQRVASTVVDQPYQQYPNYGALPPGQVVEPGYPLPAGQQQGEIPGRHNPELEYRGPRELPPGKR
ncbi:DUF4407 domain-containing protein [Nocardia sp. SYP-A9097]|uniref:DUF4407 domain-containing protein n=1 Tax=Nocardia sp. SYP-A9097 TaxID=2663237 RepID=UPI00129B443D|nr:DUF4407 domain-containing protein [Nocardia sp. SYP-A9097]MRH86264.1 DUF4407 domain-containing protein [Nocardia sp. SYP-A9097]